MRDAEDILERKFFIMKIVKTISFTATLGVNRGYGHANEQKSASQIVGGAWQQAAAEIFQSSGIYVSAIIKDSKAVYHTDWGCPAGGEVISEISGVCNPQYTDINQYKSVVLQVLERCAKALGQDTTQVVFTDCDFAHLDFRK